jgi:hypothetical protein
VYILEPLTSLKSLGFLRAVMTQEGSFTPLQVWLEGFILLPLAGEGGEERAG